MPVSPSHTFLLTHDPSPEDITGFCKIISAHLDQGGETYLYCIYHGISSVYSREIQSLRQQGLKLMGCAYAAEIRRLPLDDSAVFCGLGMLSDILLHSTILTLFPLAPVSLAHKKLFIHPRKGSPSDEDVFEIFRVASGLAAVSNLKITIAIPPLKKFPDLLANPEFQHLQKICADSSVPIVDSRVHDEKKYIVLEF